MDPSSYDPGAGLFLSFYRLAPVLHHAEISSILKNSPMQNTKRPARRYPVTQTVFILSHKTSVIDQLEFSNPQ